MSSLASLNLARRPFVNRRPALRLAVVLWALAVALTAANVSLYVSGLGAGLSKEQQAEVRRQIELERDAVRELADRLAPYDIGRINEVASFLNQRIAERTFAWSTLFDHLAEAMPGDVRLTSLAPDFVEDFEGGRRLSQTVVEDSDVRLQIRGVARSDEALLEFVDRLFAHQRFHTPDLTSERRKEAGVEFALTALYQPVDVAAAEEKEAPADEIGGSESGEPVDDPAAGEAGGETADPAGLAVALEAAR